MKTTSPTRTCTRLAIAALALIALSGCATLSSDGGFGPVEQTVRDRLGKDVKWIRSDADRDAIDKRVAQLLEQPLSADDAVQYRSIQFNLARLLMLPTINQIESRRFEQTRGAVALSVLSLASETRTAYYLAVAADETGRYMLQVQTAAEAGAELARRQTQAGNWNKLQQAREQSFYADAALNLARAEQARTVARERLTRLMGLWGQQTQFRLPERLPDLPKAPNDLPDIEQTAMAQRMDVQAAKLGTEQLARNLGLTRATRFVNVLEVGLVRNSYRDAPTERGYTISVELPLFDWGDARVAKAEATYMQAVNRAAETAINARSEVRGAYANYRTSYDIARHFRDEIVPLKKRISEENQLR